MAEVAAVQVRDAVKTYDGRSLVLNHMNMTVPRGSIYGLLGSSGCGKTSILSCIVGLRQLDSGEILVFGRQPGEGLSGKRPGYMPQDIALYPNFTIREILLYFGRIYGMPKSDILKRVDTLTKFLQLPHSSKRISQLSGGQQRRTSLATAFVHDPELLILDEPTVGVDPILRASIWDHLCEMGKNGTTVIVTTHYIEEARRSNMIGLMRNGRLLAEDSPQNLLSMFNVPLLEDIVLQLCKQDHRRIKENRRTQDEDVNESDRNGNQIVNTSPYPRGIARVTTSNNRTKPFQKSFLKCTGAQVDESQDCNCVVIGYNKTEHSGQPENLNCGTMQATLKSSNTEASISARFHRINSLIRRNVIYFVRNILFFLMILIFPAIQTTLVAITIGGDPKNMTLAVINHELPDWTNQCNFTHNICDTGPYSCRYLEQLASSNINLAPFSSKEEALKQIQLGKMYGILSIPSNYSQYIIQRNAYGNYVDNETLQESTISVQLDMSNYVASILLTRQLYGSLESYAIELAKDCGQHPEMFQVPLVYKTPVYGYLESKYTDYVVPGALVMILFLIPMCACGLAFVADKRQGTMDRSRVAGVTTIEMMVSFLVTDGIIIIIQALLSTTIIVFGFNFEIKGSIFLYGALCLLTGYCGQSWGFVLGQICSDEASLLLTAFTIHFPMLLVGGIIWPLIAIPKYFRYLSHCLPVTASLHSMRSIVARGVGFTDARVWPGFAIVTAWILLSWTVAAVKYKASRK